MIDVTDIVIATIGILAAFVTVKLIPLIKSKIGEKHGPGLRVANGRNGSETL